MMQKGWGIGRYVALEKYIDPRVEPNLDLPSANRFQIPRTAAFETRYDWALVVKDWLTRLLLDMILAGFEDDLASL